MRNSVSGGDSDGSAFACLGGGTGAFSGRSGQWTGFSESDSSYPGKLWAGYLAILWLLLFFGACLAVRRLRKKRQTAGGSGEEEAM